MPKGPYAYRDGGEVGDRLTFSPDGTQIATGSRDKTARVWDVATGKQIRALTGHTDQVFSVAFSPAGTLLATGSEDNTARIWH